jgi:pantetheine-phosphate adenylyltransferase
VAVICNPEKEAFFSVAERMAMLKAAAKRLKNVKVESFSGLLADYAREKKAVAIVRGLRVVSDFDYEFQMALTNRKMAPEIETLFFMTDYKYSYLSSSFVKQIAGFGGSVSELVPKPVAAKLGAK